VWPCSQVDDKYAIMCVQHDYAPTVNVKLAGRASCAASVVTFVSLRTRIHSPHPPPWPDTAPSSHCVLVHSSRVSGYLNILAASTSLAGHDVLRLIV
jgi:hypothetical protein